jgi:hypothetical protein
MLPGPPQPHPPRQQKMQAIICIYIKMAKGCDVIKACMPIAYMPYRTEVK